MSSEARSLGQLVAARARQQNSRVVIPRAYFEGIRGSSSVLPCSAAHPSIRRLSSGRDMGGAFRLTFRTLRQALAENPSSPALVARAAAASSFGIFSSRLSPACTAAPLRWPATALGWVPTTASESGCEHVRSRARGLTGQLLQRGSAPSRRRRPALSRSQRSSVLASVRVDGWVG